MSDAIIPQFGAPVFASQKAAASLSKKERTRRALAREPVDRLPTQVNYTAAMGEKLAAWFHVPASELDARLDNHLLRVDVTSSKKVSVDGLVAFDWWGAGWSTQTEGYWHSSAPMAEDTDLDRYTWPHPHDPALLDGAQRAIRADGQSHFVIANFGFALFERAWSLRGFDALLVDLMDRPAWVEALLDRITDIQVTLARRFVSLGVDGGYFGDDYGSQQSLLFSPRIWRQMFKPRLARMFAVFREAGMPVILHSDGDIRAILPDLVDIGVTALNPIQPEVLDHAWLWQHFGNHLAFYGGISTQDVLLRGAEEDIRAATETCLRVLAPNGTGLLVGPSHRMQSDIRAESVEAMLSAFRLDLRKA
jgi:uroporphyrinogen decarboxylase